MRGEPGVPKGKSIPSDRTIGRLSLYRRLLYDRIGQGKTTIHSHELAQLAGGSAAQVRRDLMAIGYSGSPNRGYDVEKLTEGIGNFLDDPKGQGAALVGVGNLGRAILTYFPGRRPKLNIVAAFDTDSAVTGHLVHGCYCHPVENLPRIIRSQGIRIGIITVPAEEAQKIADVLVEAGVQGILNFAPVALRVPPGIYVEQNDITTSLEKVAFFAREQSETGDDPGGDSGE
jgi:redox-sensing transcriptional repressor